MSSGIVFLSVDQLLLIHQRMIDEFGGCPDVRDRGLLESAAAIPGAHFGGQFLHPNLAEMAAAYLFHLCMNHPFVDGNKRTALAAAELFMLANRHELKATNAELEEITFGVAAGSVSKQELTAFFEQHVSSK
jgi:death-on-curing protein